MPNLFYHAIISIGLMICTRHERGHANVGGLMTVFLFPQKIGIIVNVFKKQKNSYERIISAKDDDISNLKDTVTNLRKQQDIANDQIKELTTVTKQAQSLNLADKSPEQIKMFKGDAETSNEKSSSDKKVDSPTERPTKKHWWQF